MCSSHGCMLDGLLADMLFMLIISGQGQVKQLLFDPTVCICFSDSSNLGAWEGLETFHVSNVLYKQGCHVSDYSPGSIL